MVQQFVMYQATMVDAQSLEIHHMLCVSHTNREAGSVSQSCYLTVIPFKIEALSECQLFFVVFIFCLASSFGCSL